MAVRRIIEPQISDDDEYQEDSKPDFLLRRRVRKYKNRPRSDTDFPDDNDDGSSESSDSSEFTTEEDENDSQSGNKSSSEEVSETFEDYSPPDYEPSQDPPGLESTIDGRFLWILLWIMSFRTRFNITETATETLIKFMKLVLIEIGGDDFKTFSDSIYLTKKILGLENNFQSFVSYLKCHKLYQKQEVTNF